MKVMKREGGEGGDGKIEEKNSKFKHAFLESAALCYYYFSFFSLAQRQFQKERLILIIRRPFPFLFYFVFHLCGGGRISGACDSFDRPPHLCAQAHVKWSQLWLRSRHTITASGTKGNSEKGKKVPCAERAAS